MRISFLFFYFLTASSGLLSSLNIGFLLEKERKKFYCVGQVQKIEKIVFILWIFRKANNLAVKKKNDLFFTPSKVSFLKPEKGESSPILMIDNWPVGTQSI